MFTVHVGLVAQWNLPHIIKQFIIEQSSAYIGNAVGWRSIR